VAAADLAAAFVDTEAGLEPGFALPGQSRPPNGHIRDDGPHVDVVRRAPVSGVDTLLSEY
jgi:hypothetical protein